MAWHTATIVANSHGNPTAGGTAVTIRWRTQNWRCCGTTYRVAGTLPPVWIDQSRPTFEVRPTAVQCAGCGSIKAATFSAAVAS